MTTGVGGGPTLSGQPAHVTGAGAAWGWRPAVSTGSGERRRGGPARTQDRPRWSVWSGVETSGLAQDPVQLRATDGADALRHASPGSTDHDLTGELSLLL